MNAQYNCPSSQRLARQLTRHSHSRGHCLVDTRCHQETPDNFSLWEQFVIVLVMKGPNADRTVTWSTSHNSTQTRATNNQTALGIEISLYIVYDTTLFLDKIHTQHQRSRFRLIHKQMHRDSEVTKSIISDWESGQGCSLG